MTQWAESVILVISQKRRLFIYFKPKDLAVRVSILSTVGVSAYVNGGQTWSVISLHTTHSGCIHISLEGSTGALMLRADLELHCKPEVLVTSEELARHVR